MCVCGGGGGEIGWDVVIVCSLRWLCYCGNGGIVRVVMVSVINAWRLRCLYRVLLFHLSVNSCEKKTTKNGSTWSHSAWVWSLIRPISCDPDLSVASFLGHCIVWSNIAGCVVLIDLYPFTPLPVTLIPSQGTVSLTKVDSYGTRRSVKSCRQIYFRLKRRDFWQIGF